MQRLAEFIERERLHVELQIGPFLVAVRAREGAKLGRRHGQRPAPAERIIEAHQRAAEDRAVIFVERADAGDFVDQPQLQMVLQIFPDARPVDERDNAVFAQLRARPDPRQQQKLHRADGAGGENDLAAAMRDFGNAILAEAHARCAFSREHDRLGEAVRFPRADCADAARALRTRAPRTSAARAAG